MIPSICGWSDRASVLLEQAMANRNSMFTVTWTDILYILAGKGSVLARMSILLNFATIRWKYIVSLCVWQWSSISNIRVGWSFASCMYPTICQLVTVCFYIFFIIRLRRVRFFRRRLSINHRAPRIWRGRWWHRRSAVRCIAWVWVRGIGWRTNWSCWTSVSR